LNIFETTFIIIARVLIHFLCIVVVLCFFYLAFIMKQRFCKNDLEKQKAIEDMLGKGNKNEKKEIFSCKR